MTITLGAWLHTLDPFLVRFSETFGIRWYGLSYLTGFFVAWLLLRWMSGRGLTLIPRDRVFDALMWFAGGVIIGGRLGYVLVYQPSLITEFSSRPPWWGVLAINQGGMASHGGMVGVILAAVRVSRGWRDPDGTVRGRCPVPHILDILGLISPPGLFFGRIANFINGELLGRIVTPPGQEGPWWSVQYPQELRGWIAPGVREGHAPALSPQQQHQLSELVAGIRQPGESFPHAVERLIEHAGDHAAALKPLLASRHPSQLYQAVAEGLIVGAVVWLVFAKPRKPGVVAAWFLISYGVLRILTELIRLPDPQFGAAGRIAGLSRGQWLSVAMIVAGVGLLIWASRRAAVKLGGWLRRTPAPASPA